MIFHPNGDAVPTIRELCGIVERAPDANDLTIPDVAIIPVAVQNDGMVEIRLNRINIESDDGDRNAWVYHGDVIITDSVL